MFYGLTTSYHVFKATDSKSKLFDQGGEWGGWMFAIYSIVCFLVAFVLPALAKNLGRKTTHALALVCGGLGLLGMYFVNSPNAQYLTMVGVGIAWASILAMPYAILSGALPAKRMGVYMGIFNFFIVIPEIVASFTFGPIIKAVFGENSHIAPLYVVMIGGLFMLIAAVCVLFVSDVADVTAPVLADEEEAFNVQQNAQPVPSSGLVE
jgi:maltose/moltooligosaccharide transporter